MFIVLFIYHFNHHTLISWLSFYFPFEILQPQITLTFIELKFTLTSKFFLFELFNQPYKLLILHKSFNDWNAFIFEHHELQREHYAALRLFAEWIKPGVMLTIHFFSISSRSAKTNITQLIEIKLGYKD